MTNYITIDGGTTNTRISLVKAGAVLDTTKLSLGARSGIDKPDALKMAIKDGIEKLLMDNQMHTDEIEKILASGMITSEFGLYCLPHILAPAGVKELHANMAEVQIPEISPIPFVFMPGVKIMGDTLAETDMMRGEETELMGIMDGAEEACVYVLPGSHSKVIFTDATGRITGFSTMLTGEMIAALSGGTILKDAVDLSVTEVDDSSLTDGYCYCMEHGINEALFKVRILKNLFGKAPVQTYSFFMGVVLAPEVEQIQKSGCKKIVLGGKSPIKEAMATLLQGSGEVICLDTSVTDAATINGQMKIYEYRNQ